MRITYLGSISDLRVAKDACDEPVSRKNIAMRENMICKQLEITSVKACTYSFIAEGAL
jgi:hypothetical protein